MKSKIIEIDGTKIMVAIDENDGTIHAETYKETDPPETKKPPVGIRDKIQLSDWLISQGYIRGSKEYDKAFTEHKGELPLEANNYKNLE